MEWFYVQGGEQRGPVDEAELIRLRSTGELKDASLVWKEGMGDWVRFDSLSPGLTGTPSSGGGDQAARTPGEVPPMAVTAAPTPKADNAPEAGVPEDYRVDIGSCLSRGWQLLTGNFWPIVGVSLLIQIINGCAQQIGVGMVVLFIPLISGLQYYYLVQIRGGTGKIDDAFAGFKESFAQLALINLVGSVILFASMIPGAVLFIMGMVMVESGGGGGEGFGSGLGAGLILAGGVLAVLPLVYFLVAWMFAGMLAIDRGAKFWPAMMVSMKTVNQRFGSCFLFVLLLSILSALGTLVFCVGVLVSSPWALIASTYLYEDVFGKRGAS